MAANRLPAMLVLVLVSLVPPLAAISRSELEVWRTRCPYNIYCTVDSIQRTNLTHHPCCLQCSCEEDCSVIENCCPDAPIIQTADTTQRASCRPMCWETEDPIALSECRSDHQSYRVLDFCPVEFASLDPLTKDKCEGRLVDDLDDVAAVSDAKNRIYKNKHCAKCHGARETVSWTLELHSCAKDITTGSLPASQYLPAILDHCIIVSVPPEGSANRFQGMLCGPNMYSSCSSSTSGNDENVDRCINGPYMPYQHQTERGRILTYKNIFCFICSKAIPPQLQHLCLVSQSGDVKRTFHSLTLVLDKSVDTAVRSEFTKQHRCGDTELYDHVQDRCVAVACPPYNLVMFGDCISMGLSTSKYPFFLQIVYTTTNTHLFTDPIHMYDNDLSQKYVITTLRSYGLARCDVSEFHAVAFVEKKTSILAFVRIELIVSSDGACDIGHISAVARAKMSVPHKTSVLINGKNIVMFGQLNFYEIDIYGQPLYTGVTLVSVFQTENLSPLPDFFPCPYFKIGVDEYNSILTEIYWDGRDRNISDISEMTQVEQGFYVLNNDSIAVCTDTYFKLYRTNKGTATRALESTNLICYWIFGYMLIYSSFLDLGW